MSEAMIINYLSTWPMATNCIQLSNTKLKLVADILATNFGFVQDININILHLKIPSMKYADLHVLINSREFKVTS